MSDYNSKIIQPKESLITDCKNGDSGSYKILIEMYQQFAYTLAFRILLNEERAKDATQVSFIKVWKGIKNFNSHYLFTTWFYKIIVNTCYDILKSDKAKNKINDELANINTEFQLAELISNKDLIRHIKHLSRGLPAKQRMVFILKDLQDLSISEVSKILEMPKGAVKSNLYYARKYIKEKIITIDNGGVKDGL